MGRGGDTTEGHRLVPRNNTDAFSTILSEAEKLIGLWRMRSKSEEEDQAKNLEDIIQARSQALKRLTYQPEEQRKLMLAARQASEIIAFYEKRGVKGRQEKILLERSRKVNNDARELFILCHRGFVDHLVTKHINRFDSESTETARDILRQACDIGLHRTIDRYNFDDPSNPLTYATRVMLDEIKREAEAGRLIRLKSKANTLGDKIEKMAKEIEADGREVTIAEISDRLQETPQRIAEILPHARRRTVRLDAPLANSEGENDSLGAIIPDQITSVENLAIDSDTREKIIKAIATLAPFERKVVEVAYGLGENKSVEAKDLFDGVYRDKKGQGYSSRTSIIEERGKRGENIIKMSQKELTEKFKNSEFVFEPGNPEAHALALAGKGTKIVPGKTVSRYITQETGIPPTPGVIQGALKQALKSLAKSQQLKGMELKYRGDNILENSAKARQWARDELVRRGKLSRSQADKLTETRTLKGKKSKLRLLAEENGLVDPEKGNRIA